jgi:hypothetical protein
MEGDEPKECRYQDAVPHHCTRVAVCGRKMR